MDHLDSQGLASQTLSMSRIIAITLFCVLLFATLLGLSMSLAPGLSVKNVLLYIVIIYLILRGVIDTRAGGLLDEPIPLAALHLCFISLVVWTTMSWFFVSFISKHVVYDSLDGLMAMKGAIIDLYLVFIAFFFTVREKDELIRTVYAVLGAIAIYNAITFVDLFTPLSFGLAAEFEGTKIWGPMGHSNQYGCFLAFSLPSLIAVAINSRGLQRFLMGVAGAISFILLIATEARAAYLGSVVGVVLTIYLFRHRLSLSTSAKYGVLAIPVVVVLLFVSGLWDVFYDRVVVTTSRATNINDVSSGRLSIWSDVLSRQAQNIIGLIFGMGWDTYKQSGWFRLSAHNTYLKIYFELGIIGAALYLTAMILVVREAIKGAFQARKDEQNLMLGFTMGVCSLIICMLFSGLNVALLFVWAYTGLALKLAYLILTSSRAESSVLR